MARRIAAPFGDRCYACRRGAPAPIPGATQQSGSAQWSRRLGKHQMKLAPLVIALVAAVGAIALMAKSPTNTVAPVQIASR